MTLEHRLRVADRRDRRTGSLRSPRLVVMLALLLHASPALGQTPPARRDSVARDSITADTVRQDSARLHRNHHMMQAALYALVVAPAGLAAMAVLEDSTAPVRRLGYWTDHVAVYATGGLADGRDGPVLGASWTGSGSIEVMKRGFLLEARSEHFELLRSVEYRTVRVGRLFHPHSRVAGGITFGYRRVIHLIEHDGFEIAFPFVGGAENTWVRLESAYVMSMRQSSWNYRLQGERRLGDGPFVVGFSIDLKSWELRSRGELSHGAVSVMLGVASWR